MVERHIIPVQVHKVPHNIDGTYYYFTCGVDPEVIHCSSDFIINYFTIQIEIRFSFVPQVLPATYY
jgi:hypothetical protein